MTGKKMLSAVGHLERGTVLWETSRGAVTCVLQGADTVVRVLDEKGGLRWAATLHCGTPQRVRSLFLAEALDAIDDRHICPGCKVVYAHVDWLALPMPKGGEYQLDEQGGRLQLRACSACYSTVSIQA